MRSVREDIEEVLGVDKQDIRAVKRQNDAYQNRKGHRDDWQGFRGHT